MYIINSINFIIIGFIGLLKLYVKICVKNLMRRYFIYEGSLYWKLKYRWISA